METAVFSSVLTDRPWATGGESNTTPVAGKIYLFYTENLLGSPSEDLDTSIAAKVYTVDIPVSDYSKALAAGADGKFFAGAPCLTGNSGMAYLIDIYSDKCTEIGNN